MAKPLVSIIGGGIGGLALARCLKHKGIPAVVYERAAQPKSNNYGITLYPSSFRQLLTALDVNEQSFRSKVAVDAAAPGLVSSNTEIITANRGKLEAWMREGLDIKWKHKLKKVDIKSAGTSAKTHLIFENESPVESDMTIGVDGPHSALRTSIFPGQELTILPFVAFNGKRRYNRSTFQSLYPTTNGPKTDCRQDDVRVNVTINDVSSDEVNLSWTYSRPARTPVDPLHKPDRSPEGATKIPEEFYEEIAVLKKSDLSPLFDDILDPERLKSERILHWLMRITLLPLKNLQEAAKNNIVFIGDAVHAEPILGGQGANRVIEDAVSLANWIADGKCLKDWYETRYSTWKTSVTEAEEQIKELHFSGQAQASL